MLSQVHVALPWTLSISTLFTFIGVLSTTITYVFGMFILIPIRLLYFNRIVLLAYVVGLVVCLCIGIIILEWTTSLDTSSRTLYCL